MRIFKFIKFLFDETDKAIFLSLCFLIGWIIPVFVIAIFTGSIKILMLIPISFALIILSTGIYNLFKWIKNAWSNFNEVDPSDDIKIIRKLKGIS